MPAIWHWGAALGSVDDETVSSMLLASTPPRTNNSVDVPVEVGILPEARWCWVGRPGLVGSRAGHEWSPAWEVRAVRVDGAGVESIVRSGAGVVEYDCVAPGQDLP